jgi:hypothetical protein
MRWTQSAKSARKDVESRCWCRRQVGSEDRCCALSTAEVLVWSLGGLDGYSEQTNGDVNRYRQSLKIAPIADDRGYRFTTT